MEKEGPELFLKCTNVPDTFPTTFQPEALLFSRVAVGWREWAEAWEQDRAGKGVPQGFLDGVRLLPPVEGIQHVSLGTHDHHR